LHTSSAVEAREKVLEEALTSQTADEKIKYLSRCYVNMEFMYYFEKAYSMIYGSQILLLEMLEQNVAVGINDNLIRNNYYNTAVAKYPGMYETYSYESYMNFLTSHILIMKEGEVWKITNYGLDFMKYLRTSSTLALARERLG